MPFCWLTMLTVSRGEAAGLIRSKRCWANHFFLQEGAEHQRNRRLLMPAFHGKALEGYFSTMVALSNAYLADWEQKGQFVWFTELKKFTFEVASVLLVGMEPSRTAESENQASRSQESKNQESGVQIEQMAAWFTDLTNGLFALPIRWGADAL